MAQWLVRFLRCTVSLFLSSLTLAAQAPAPNLNDPETLLLAARATNGLSGDDLKPWHLKASYDLFDDDGKPLAKGEFEEWWVAKDRWKRSYTGDHYTGKVYRSSEGFATEGPQVSWPESLIASAIISPIEEKYPDTLHPSPPSTISTINPPLSCMAMSSKDSGKSAPPYNYCFDAGTSILRMRSAQYISAAYPRTGLFQKRHIGIETSIQVNHRTIAAIHVASLIEEESPSAASAPEQPLPFSASALEREDPSWKAPQLVYGKDVQLPPDQEINGNVTMEVVIDNTGKVTECHIIDSPDEKLSQAAKAAVLHWRFSPARLRGQKTQADLRMLIHVGHE